MLYITLFRETPAPRDLSSTQQDDAPDRMRAVTSLGDSRRHMLDTRPNRALTDTVTRANSLRDKPPGSKGSEQRPPAIAERSAPRSGQPQQRERDAASKRERMRPGTAEGERDPG